QPWQAPLVGALGKVYPCCGGAGVIGDLSKQSMRQGMNGERARAIRASILEGRPIINCQSCSFAVGQGFAELPRDVREWMGDSSLPPFDSDVERTVWRGLLGSREHDVVVENAKLNVDDGGAAALIENGGIGYHRVYFDVARAERSEIRFRVRPAGRRRLRLDFCDRATMVGRAHIVLSHQPRVTAPIGGVRCHVIPGDDRWYHVSAALPSAQPVSEVGFLLMREDDAVNYSGDGSSGLELAAISLT